MSACAVKCSFNVSILAASGIVETDVTTPTSGLTLHPVLTAVMALFTAIVYFRVLFSSLDYVFLRQEMFLVHTCSLSI